MDEYDVLAERFEAHRPRPRALAYQTLGSAGEQRFGLRVRAAGIVQDRPLRRQSLLL